MNDILLKIENLNIKYPNSSVNAVKNVSFELKKGETLGIIGESGSGKSSIALSIMGILDKETKITGKILYNNQNILEMSEDEKNSYRWKKIALVFQNSLEVFNPVLTIQEHLIEVIMTHNDILISEAKNKAKYYLNLVGIERDMENVFPHQLSGGLRQKVLIAMALSCEPELLIVDEPTMALDTISKMEIVSLFLKLKNEKNYSILIISHELSIIRSLAENLVVMYLGNVFEIGKTLEILDDPAHPYSRGLIYSSPSVNEFRDIWGIPGEISLEYNNGCPFFSRCTQKIDICKNTPLELKKNKDGRFIACTRNGIIKLIEGINITKTYHTDKHIITACNNCNISIQFGEVYTLIGQSGSGKSTFGEILAGILSPDSGEVFYKGTALNKLDKGLKQKEIQLVFQDPFSAINGKLSIKDIIKEPLDILKIGNHEERIKKVIEVLKYVQLPFNNEFLNKKGEELSGGQRQRIAIARALIMKPQFLIADEITAMLDPSTAANILRLLKELQNKFGFAMLYITHDLDLAKKISDKVMVMLSGNIIEKGNAESIFKYPQHSYTKKLLQHL